MFTSTETTWLAIRSKYNIPADIPLRLVESTQWESFGMFNESVIVDWRPFGTLDMRKAVSEHSDEQALMALQMLLDDPDRYDSAARELAHLIDDGFLGESQVRAVADSLKATLKRHPEMIDDPAVGVLIEMIQDHPAIFDGNSHQEWDKR